MYKQVPHFLAGLLLGMAPLWAAAGIVPLPSVPGFGEPSYSQEELEQAYGQGRSVGRQEAASECLASPENCGCQDGINPCGVTLSSVLSGANFGETEPNNHIVAADGLIPQVLYWAQTPWIQDNLGEWHPDVDYFYLTTDEPNQLVTINFTVPDRVLADTDRLSQGWLISLRDAAGNVYAEFDTRFALDDLTTTNKNESKEIAYPVFLGHTGTYYISVEPRIDDGSGGLVTDPTLVSLDVLSVTFSPYTLAVVLEYSGLDSVQPDVNFHDVELEDNDHYTRANPLASGVTLYGSLHQKVVDAATGAVAGDQDWFSYSTPGYEQIALAWCGRDACEEDAVWTIDVINPDGSILVSTSTDKAKTLHFSLGAAGTYYFRVQYQVDSNAVCIEYSTTDIVCKADPELKCFKDTNNQYADNACAVVANESADIQPDDTPCEDANYLTPCYRGGPQSRVWTEQTALTFCSSAVLAPNTGCNRDGEFPEFDPDPTGDPSLVPDDLIGLPRYRAFQYQEACTAGIEFACLAYEVVDPDALNVQYNFTWWGTQLPPLTNGTEAYDEFQERPSFYQDR